MFKATDGMVLPTTMTGSYPKPNWYTQGLRGRPFKKALGDTLFREQYLDAVAAVITDQEMAGLDILTDGDSRFDLEVGESHGSSMSWSGWAACRAARASRQAGLAISLSGRVTSCMRCRKRTNPLSLRVNSPADRWTTQQSGK